MREENYQTVILAFLLLVFIIGGTLSYFHPGGVSVELAKAVNIVDSTEMSGRLCFFSLYPDFIYFRLDKNPSMLYRVNLDTAFAKEIESLRITVGVGDSIVKLRDRNTFYLVKQDANHYYHIYQ